MNPIAILNQRIEEQILATDVLRQYIADKLDGQEFSDVDRQKLDDCYCDLVRALHFLREAQKLLGMEPIQ
jgi:hypothetical protein